MTSTRSPLGLTVSPLNVISMTWPSSALGLGSVEAVWLGSADALSLGVSVGVASALLSCPSGCSVDVESSPHPVRTSTADSTAAGSADRMQDSFEMGLAATVADGSRALSLALSLFPGGRYWV